MDLCRRGTWLVLLGLLSGCGSMPANPEAALKSVDGEIIRDEQRPGRPVVEVRLVDPYATCPPFLLFDYVSDEHLAPLREFPELKKLTIKSDKVTDAGLVHLAGLTKLESLDLHFENITDAGLAELRDLTNLRELRIVGSSRTGNAGLAHLVGMQQLQSLELTCSHKTTPEGLAVLARMPLLKRLKVTGIGFDDLDVVPLESLAALESLEVDFHKLSDAGLAHLGNLTALKTLNLCTAPWAIGGEDNTLTDAGLAHLSKLTALEELHLPRGIGDAGLTHLQVLTNLKRLDLGHTSVTDEGLIGLSGLAQLESLDLPRGTVSDGAVTQLQQALPNLKIELRNYSWLPPPSTFAGPPSPPGS